MIDAPTPAGSDAETAWAEELGRLASLVAHEVNNLLNGVSVNLEVVRSRAAKNADSSAVAPFAETASAQLELLTSVVRAMIALTKPAPEALSLTAELGNIAAVIGVVAAAKGGELSIDRSDSEFATCVSGATARLLLASSLRLAAEPGARVQVGISTQGRDTVVRVARPGSSGVALPQVVARTAANAGVHMEHVTDALLLRFPAGPLHSTP